MSYVYKTMQSPVGQLTLIAGDKGLAAILWDNDDPKRVRVSADKKDAKNSFLVQAEKQLNEYFEGKRTAFCLELDFVGTAFQKKVWRELMAIPYGETKSYGQLAKKIGNPKAARAVGAASGKNPISIIGPCHRVIGANGKLTGFAGGLEAKEFLLALEAKKQKNQSLRPDGLRLRS